MYSDLRINNLVNDEKFKKLGDKHFLKTWVKSIAGSKSSLSDFPIQEYLKTFKDEKPNKNHATFDDFKSTILLVALHLTNENAYPFVAKLIGSLNQQITLGWDQRLVCWFIKTSFSHLNIYQKYGENQRLLDALRATDLKPLTNFFLLNSDLPLQQAIINGDEKEVRNLLKTESKTDIDKPDQNDFTPLFCAIFCDRIDIVEILIQHNADVNLNSLRGTPLGFAVHRGNLPIADLLIKKQARINGTGDYFLTNDGIFETRQSLIQQKKFIRNLSWTPILIAANNHDWELLNYLRKQHANLNALTPDKNTILHLAATSYSDQCLSLITDNNINFPNLRGETPLLYAAMTYWDEGSGLSEDQKINFLQQLIDRKAKVDQEMIEKLISHHRFLKGQLPASSDRLIAFLTREAKDQETAAKKSKTEKKQRKKDAKEQAKPQALIKQKQSPIPEDKSDDEDDTMSFGSPHSSLSSSISSTSTSSMSTHSTSSSNPATSISSRPSPITIPAQHDDNEGCNIVETKQMKNLRRSKSFKHAHQHNIPSAHEVQKPNPQTAVARKALMDRSSYQQPIPGVSYVSSFGSRPAPAPTISESKTIDSPQHIETLLKRMTDNEIQIKTKSMQEKFQTAAFPEFIHSLIEILTNYGPDLTKEGEKSHTQDAESSIKIACSYAGKFFKVLVIKEQLDEINKLVFGMVATPSPIHEQLKIFLVDCSIAGNNIWNYSRYELHTLCNKLLSAKKPEKEPGVQVGELTPALSTPGADRLDQYYTRPSP